MNIDLSDIDDPEDPRVAEAADDVIAGLRSLVGTLGLDVSAALYDAIAERLDVLCDEVADKLEQETEDGDDALLAEVDNEDED